MNWLPNLLNWPTAGIAALLAIPPLVALYFLKLRRKEAPISSTILWTKSVQDLQVNSPFQRLRRNLLLLLQLLILAALLISLARPVSFQKAQPGARAIIVIDRSGSMNANDGAPIGQPSRTRLDEAKRQAKELVDAMPNGGRAAVIAFDNSAQTVVPFSTNRQQLKNAIDAITPTDRSTRLKLAYQLADAAMNIDPSQLSDAAQLSEVFVMSDGRVLDGDELTLRGAVKYVKLGRDDTKNIAIVGLSGRRNYDRPTQVQVFARLANFGPDPVDTQVQLAIAPLDSGEGTGASADVFEGRQVQSAARLLPVRWTDEQRRKYDAENPDAISRDSVEFNLELTTGAVIQLTQLASEGDAIAADDVARVVVPPPKRLSVAVVGEGNFYLEKVIDSLGLDKPAYLTADQYESLLPASSDTTTANPAGPAPTSYDVIVFDRYTPTKLPLAGNFVYFGCVGPGLVVKQSKAASGADEFVQNVGVLDWDRDHSLLRTLNLGKLFAGRVIKLDVPADAQTLIEGTSDQGATPLVVFHREGQSQHVHVAFDLLESNWPLRESFPIFIYNLMQFLATSSELSVRESYPPGSTPRLPRVALARVVDASTKSIQLTGPGTQKTIELPTTGDVALPALDDAGVYRTRPVIPGFERIAVNLLDENESNVLPMSQSPGSVGIALATSESRSRVEWWWWVIACVGVPLLMAEWYVYTRRVHA